MSCLGRHCSTCTNFSCRFAYTYEDELWMLRQRAEHQRAEHQRYHDRLKREIEENIQNKLEDGRIRALDRRLPEYPDYNY